MKHTRSQNYKSIVVALVGLGMTILFANLDGAAQVGNLVTGIGAEILSSVVTAAWQALQDHVWNDAHLLCPFEMLAMFCPVLCTIAGAV